MKYSRNIFSGDSYAPFYHVFLEVDDISKPLSAEQRNMVNLHVFYLSSLQNEIWDVCLIG